MKGKYKTKKERKLFNKELYDLIYSDPELLTLFIMVNGNIFCDSELILKYNKLLVKKCFESGLFDKHCSLLCKDLNIDVENLNSILLKVGDLNGKE